MPYQTLSPKEKEVIVDHATEPPFSGQYDNFYEAGTFICRRCHQPLFSSASKFDAQCGWPAFDQFLDQSVISSSDPDGQRVEISCAHCRAHLGHVFTGEHFTSQNTRHCVNSLSLKFIPQNKPLPPLLYDS
jgi:peptide-methionine (R)-S-oxide reductase